MIYPRKASARRSVLQYPTQKVTRSRHHFTPATASKVAKRGWPLPPNHSKHSMDELHFRPVHFVNQRQENGELHAINPLLSRLTAMRYCHEHSATHVRATIW
jgi:hypothetical protein